MPKLARHAQAVEPRAGLQVRLLICDRCNAVWPTERDPSHGGSRLDGEPCAYAWDGKVCPGTVGPIWIGGRRPYDESRTAPPSASKAAYSGAWCEILGVPWGTTDLALVRTKYRARVKLAHPDAGGSHEAMVELNLAYRQALAELGQPGG